MKIGSKMAQIGLQTGSKRLMNQSA